MRISDWSSDVCSSDLVHGQPHRVAGGGGQGGEFAQRPPPGVHFHPRRARLADQLLVQRLLKPVLAHLESGKDQQRVARFLIFPLLSLAPARSASLLRRISSSAASAPSCWSEDRQSVV